MDKKSLRDVSVSGKRVFIRVDYNVPMDKAGNITNDARIQATLPTLKYLLDNHASIVIGSHLGRPKGQPVAEFSLAPVAKRLAALLGKEVKFAPDCIGPVSTVMAQSLKPGEVLLLENLRFYKEEEKNDPKFSSELAGLADIAVNDACNCWFADGKGNYFPGSGCHQSDSSICRYHWRC
jgi:phosphoglycerate kinase